MAHKIENRVSETSTSSGTGAMSLAAAAVGFRRFSAVMAVGDTCWYLIEAINAAGVIVGWELGIATYSAANVLQRTTVIASSNGNALVNFGAESKRVSMTILAPDVTTAPQWVALLGLQSAVPSTGASDQVLSFLTSVSAFVRLKTTELSTQ